MQQRGDQCGGEGVAGAGGVDHPVGGQRQAQVPVRPDEHVAGLRHRQRHQPGAALEHLLAGPDRVIDAVHRGTGQRRGFPVVGADHVGGGEDRLAAFVVGGGAVEHDKGTAAPGGLGRG